MRIFNFKKYREVSEGFNPTPIEKLKGKFPWENKSDKVIDEINSLVTKISKEFNYGAHEREAKDRCYEINIKIHDIPDMESLASTSGKTEDLLYRMWDDYLSFQMEDFQENYLLENYDWIENIYQVGKNGGWLAIKALPASDLEYRVSDIEELLNRYDLESLLYPRITADELKKLQPTMQAKKIGLLDSNLDKASDAIEAEELFDNLLVALTSELETLRSVYEDLEKIQEEAKFEMTGLTKGFVEDYLED